MEVRELRGAWRQCERCSRSPCTDRGLRGLLRNPHISKFCHLCIMHECLHASMLVCMHDLTTRVFAPASPDSASAPMQPYSFCASLDSRVAFGTALSDSHGPVRSALPLMECPKLACASRHFAPTRLEWHTLTCRSRRSSSTQRLYRISGVGRIV